MGEGSSFPHTLKEFQILLFILALLVSNTARCLASGLARCLALTATTVLCCLAKVLCFKCLNTLHGINPP